MCGIFAVQEPSRDSPVCRKGLEEMRYRGPDDQKVLRSGGFSVGLARLAIVDTLQPLAAQPLCTGKGHIVAFNGEIYNYQNLLPGAHSEIEVLGKMLDERLDPRYFLDGDYAILDYCPSTQRVTLYRDRFGMCPLYFQVKPEVTVSSERRKLNPRHAKEVPAHGKVVIDLKTRAFSVSSIPHYGITCSSGAQEMMVLRSLLLDAVLSRATHSDTGFSTTLSGGLDSSAIVLACTALGLTPDCALVVVPDKGDSDDLMHARLVAQRAKVKLVEVRVGEDRMVEDVKDILLHLDSRVLPTPMKWRASVRNWYAAKHSPTRVLLCGEGADEMFEGYPPHTERHKNTPYRVSKHQLTAIRSLPRINLDRTNKLGLAHSKEYRAPFLASTLSYWLMSTTKRAGKQALREVLQNLGAPSELLHRHKWGSDEVFFDQSLHRVLYRGRL